MTTFKFLQHRHPETSLKVYQGACNGDYFINKQLSALFFLSLVKCFWILQVTCDISSGRLKNLSPRRICQFWCGRIQNNHSPSMLCIKRQPVSFTPWSDINSIPVVTSIYIDINISHFYIL